MKDVILPALVGCAFLVLVVSTVYDNRNKINNDTSCELPRHKVILDDGTLTCGIILDDKK
jgi:hypothetical protein